MNDVNEYAPVFKEKNYQAAVAEGRRYESILRVEAADADCSPQFSQICSYEIVTPDVPFTVDKDGEDRGQVRLAGDGPGRLSLLSRSASHPNCARQGNPSTGQLVRAGSWNRLPQTRWLKRDMYVSRSGGWEVQVQGAAHAVS